MTRPWQFTAECGCTGRAEGGALILAPCRLACRAYRHAVLAAAIRYRPVVTLAPVVPIR